jgi:hypothetical protein
MDNDTRRGLDQKADNWKVTNLEQEVQRLTRELASANRKAQEAQNLAEASHRKLQELVQAMIDELNMPTPDNGFVNVLVNVMNT